MDAGKPFSIPVRLIVLDVIGTFLLAAGLLKVVARVDFLPQQVLFEGYGVAFIVGGAILMVPLIVHVLARAISRSGQPIER
jgi:hypothetical protein